MAEAALPGYEVDGYYGVLVPGRTPRPVVDRLHGEFDRILRLPDIAQQMAVIEEKMLETCKQFNADSIRTPYGTIVRSVKSRYWTNDWDSMHRFISEHHAFGLLEKRLHQTHMKEFLSENPDLLPVGLNVENAYTVVVRRSKGS
jgi:hypothetical protein